MRSDPFTFIAMIRIFLLTLFASMLSMCASTKQYTLDELPDERLIFSFGGGFTGAYEFYMLLPNGQLFHKRQVTTGLSFREFEPVDRKEAKDLFETYQKQEFSELGYNDPGNMSYTIQYISPKDTSQVIWGGSEVKPEEELRTYWRRLMQVVEGKEALPEVK